MNGLTVDGSTGTAANGQDASSLLSASLDRVDVKVVTLRRSIGRACVSLMTLQEGYQRADNSLYRVRYVVSLLETCFQAVGDSLKHTLPRIPHVRGKEPLTVALTGAHTRWASFYACKQHVDKLHANIEHVLANPADFSMRMHMVSQLQKHYAEMTPTLEKADAEWCAMQGFLEDASRFLHTLNPREGILSEIFMEVVDASNACQEVPMQTSERGPVSYWFKLQQFLLDASIVRNSMQSLLLAAMDGIEAMEDHMSNAHSFLNHARSCVVVADAMTNAVAAQMHLEDATNQWPSVKQNLVDAAAQWYTLQKKVEEDPPIASEKPPAYKKKEGQLFADQQWELAEPMLQNARRECVISPNFPPHMAPKAYRLSHNGVVRADIVGYNREVVVIQKDKVAPLKRSADATAPTAAILATEDPTELCKRRRGYDDDEVITQKLALIVEAASASGALTVYQSSGEDMTSRPKYHIFKCESTATEGYDASTDLGYATIQRYGGWNSPDERLPPARVTTIRFPENVLAYLL